MKHKRGISASRKKRNRRKRVKQLWKLVGLLFTVFIVLLVYGRILAEDTGTKETQYVENEKAESEQIEITEVSEVIQEDEQTKILRVAEWILQGMTLEERIYQLFIVTQEQLTGVSQVTQSGKTTQSAIEKYPVGGIIYFADNLLSREQCKTMIENIQSYSEIGLFIAVDEEGGKVARLGNHSEMGTTSFPAMGSIGATDDTSKAYEVGYVIGQEISELGFNLDFAPVADVYSNAENTVIGERAFSSDPHVAAKMISACVQGFRDSEMLCTLKHFPGHGDTVADSHYGEAQITKTLEELYQCELIPFQEGIDSGVPLVMIGHLTAPKITEEDVPATLSYEIVTKLLREEMGFDGIVITDSMSMQAITEKYSSGIAAVKAIQAGADIVLMPQNLQDAVNGILSAVREGTLTEERIDESVLRILQAKISKNIITLDDKEIE